MSDNNNSHAGASACRGDERTESQFTAPTIVNGIFPKAGQNNAQQSTDEKTGNFKKAFSVCLEAKDYMVK